MDLSERKILKNDVVFGKVRGFCPWPCVVEVIEGNIATVKFFSRYRERYTLSSILIKTFSQVTFSLRNQISLQNITPIQEALHIMKNHFERHAEFTKYVKEVQITIGSAKSRGLRAKKIKNDMNQLLEAYINWSNQKNHDLNIVKQSAPILNRCTKSKKLKKKQNAYNLCTIFDQTFRTIDIIFEELRFISTKFNSSYINFNQMIFFYFSSKSKTMNDATFHNGSSLPIKILFSSSCSK